ncbi:hypothetical protein NMG60_11028604 [Bertholletia excelsa]
MTLSLSVPRKPFSLLLSPLPLSSSITVAAILLLLSALLCASFSSAATFSNCDRTFNCGPIQNISYPFTGGDRPDYCGPTQFRLTCRDNAYTEVTINSLTYRVLQINQTQTTLVLARPDLWNNTCPEKFVNATLDSPVFSYGIDNLVLNLFYGCSWILHFTPYNRFSCTVRGVNYTEGFYLVGPVPDDPILQNWTTCHVSVAVPVTDVAARNLTANRTTVGEALMKGFNVNYTDPYASECSKCILFGRQCAFDPDLGKPICICGIQRCPIPSVRGTGNCSFKCFLM